MPSVARAFTASPTVSLRTMRVVRCFAFLDLCGFTGYTEARGDSEAVAVLAQLRATLRAEAEHSGVRVTKWLGDGAMLSGMESEAVLRCCNNVRDNMAATSPLALRGGISEGPVIMFEGDDYIGAAVNVAARLCAIAEPGQILVADAVSAPAPRHDLGAVDVPGFSEPIEIAELPELPVQH
jgi:adenylate cyclase